METDKRKAVIYCRVSTREQVEEGGSLASQEKICNDYALKSGYSIEKVFIEQGESAKTADRTELKKLLSYCANKKNGIQAVIAYKIDRIARNIDDYRQIRILLKRYNIEIRSTTEYFEDTPAGRFMENIIANVAQFDNDVRTERSVNGMKDAVKEGRFVWGAPVGYDNVKVGNRSNIVPNDMAILVRKAFKRVAADNLPTDQIRIEMEKEGLANRSGKPMTKSYFYLMLQNELYTGWIVAFGMRCKGAFEPIITRELYEQVQRVINKRKNNTIQYKMDNPDFPLRRFIVHPSGKKLTGGWAKGRNKKYAYYQYHIPGMNFKKDTLEQVFIDYFNSFGLHEKNIARLRNSLKKAWLGYTSNTRKEIEQSRKLVANLKEQRQLLIQKNLKGVLTDEVLMEQLAMIDEQISTAKTVETFPEYIKDINLDKEFDIVAQYLKNPGRIWNIANSTTKVKLQWFNFPEGVSYDGKEFRTTDLSRLFKHNCVFLQSKSSWVPPIINQSNQFSKEAHIVKKDLAGLIKSEEHAFFNKIPQWGLYIKELITLSRILQSNLEV